MSVAAIIQFAKLVLQHWRLALFLLVCVIAGVQTWRLREAQRDIESAKLHLAAAISTSVARGATTGAEALENYVEKQNQDAPVVGRVVERVRNVCLRPRADTNRLPVPAGAGVDAQRAARVGDDEDRAYVAAIGRDLEYCNTELNRLSAIQQWIIENSGRSVTAQRGR